MIDRTAVVRINNPMFSLDNITSSEARKYPIEDDMEEAVPFILTARALYAGGVESMKYFWNPALLRFHRVWIKTRPSNIVKGPPR